MLVSSIFSRQARLGRLPDGIYVNHIREGRLGLGKGLPSKVNTLPNRRKPIHSVGGPRPFNRNPKPEKTLSLKAAQLF